MPLILLLLFSLVKTPVFYLDADLKRANYLLKYEHGVWLSKEDKPYTLKVFEPYTKLNMGDFKFSSKKDGKYTISYWKRGGKTKLEIYQVETKLHVDTAITSLVYIDTPLKRKEEKTYINTDFNYRTYIINDGGKPQLAFTISTNTEILEYRIGKRVISPTYEDMIIGLQTPNEEEILRLIAPNRKP